MDFKILESVAFSGKLKAGKDQAHKYKQGTDSTHGENVYTKYYDRAGIEAANSVNIYQQFASKREMPTKYGKELFLACCQRTIDLELPESYETCTEHKEEMARYRKDAIDHLDRIRILLDDWIEAREQYAQVLSNLPSDDADYLDRSQTEQKTSECLMGLSELMSLP